MNEGEFEHGARSGAAPRARTAFECLDRPPEAGDLAVRVEEAPLRGMIQLRADLEDPAVAATIDGALRAFDGGGLPERRRFRLAEERGAFWMAPDELMVMCAYDEAEEVRAGLDAALKGAFRLVETVSGARSIFSLTGRGAREVLAKGAPVDLHPAAFGVGDFRRTHIGGVAAALYQTDAAPERFETFCFRSYAEHFGRWLLKAARAGSLPEAMIPKG